MAKLVYQASFDNAEALKKLKEIDAAIDKIAAQGSKHFDKIGKSASLSGGQIGVVSGVVGALTSEIINLGQQAAQIFADIAADSVKLAAKFELNKGLIKNIFEGDEEAANAVIDRMIKRGAEIGLTPDAATALTVSFGPDSGSVEQLEKIVESTVKLRALNPEKTIEDIRQALEQGLSGDVAPLQDRLNLPKEVIPRIKELQKEFGAAEGLLRGLDEVFNKFGIDLETVSDTAIGQFGEMQAKLQGFQLAGGAPVVEELKEQLSGLNDVLDENSDDFELIADAVGRVLANIVDIVGSGLTDFLANLDTEQVIEISEKFFDITENARTLVGVLSSAEIGPGFINSISFIADKLDAALTTAIQISAIAQAENARQAAAAGVLADAVRKEGKEAGTEWMNNFLAGVAESGPDFITETTLALSESIGDEAAQQTAREAAAAGEEAFKKSMLESVAAIEESTKAKEENRESTNDLREAQTQSTDAGLAQADAFLQEADAAKKLAEAQEAAASAQAKIDEAVAKATTDYQRDLLEADIKFERARTDALLDGQRKREDAARKNLERLADIERKNQEAIQDARLDLSRDEQDLATKFARETIEQRRDEGQKIVDIQTDTSQKIKDILFQSQFDLDEAESKRDAVSFLRILKQRNQDISSAQQDASREVQETQLAGQRKREELKIQQEQELSDARLANERKLADLQTNLERELEAQAINFEREREEIALNEARKLTDLATARERDKEDALRNYNEKLADLDKSLADELATVQKYNALLEAEAARHAAAMEAADQTTGRPISQRQTVQGEDQVASTRQGSVNTQRQRENYASSGPGARNRQRQQGRAFGGSVNRRQSYLVGERGPELFTPNANGRIIPNSSLVMSNMSGAGGANSINNSRSQEINLPLATPGQLLDPIMIAQLRNIIATELMKVS